jgi:hypothetical protein
MNPDKFNFFEFLTSLDREQFEKYFKFLISLDQVQLKKHFLMLGPDESEYLCLVIQRVETELNMGIAEIMDEVEEPADAKNYLNGLTLSGKEK